MPFAEHRRIFVKVVLVKSPKVIGGILRKFFGIKKTT
ncbi:MAG: stage V sporulation protein SpoVM [Clostridia bacterium]|nr:stage V sporulation protein SpoVM [Oscillospiraceae bacterium]MBQ3523143.1 stage V sporulation protein SpoVM [Clostridia bacterium]